MERQVKLTDVNPLVQCKLCDGYLVQPTTVVECLHIFCRSCIVKYLRTNNNCPQCKRFLHYSYPLKYIAPDRTMQLVMDKLLPNVQAAVDTEKEAFTRRTSATENQAEQQQSTGASDQLGALSMAQ